MAYYKDFREFLQLLETKGKLQRIKREVVKETELVPLYWLQFRALPQEAWKGFLFENVRDVKGKSYGQVALGAYSSSREIMGLGMACLVEEMKEKWCRACANPVPPVMVEKAPVDEVVITGRDLEKAGLLNLPFPVECPGYSGAVRTTTQVITKDPDTGSSNIGMYSTFVTGNNSLRWAISPGRHGYYHWQKAKEKGKRLEMAIAIGLIPGIHYLSAAPLPFATDDFAIAGGIAGEPVQLVKGKTIDVEAPATSEIIIEGLVSNEYLEPQSAFGDYPGYIAEQVGAYRPVIDVTCIRHRKNPIFATQVMGFPPYDGVILSSAARSWETYRHLKYNAYIPGLLDVHFPYAGGAHNMIVIKMKKTSPWGPWQALQAAVGTDPGLGKITIVVDEDINIEDADEVNWALAFRMQPHKDMRIITHRVPRLDPSGFRPGAPEEERKFPQPSGTSAVLIDATRKWDYAPVGLPAKKYMEKAIQIWNEENLPSLTLKPLWHGYDLGRWTKQDEEEAHLMVNGEFEKYGKKKKEGRIKQV